MTEKASDSESRQSKSKYCKPTVKDLQDFIEESQEDVESEGSYSDSDQSCTNSDVEEMNVDLELANLGIDMKGWRSDADDKEDRQSSRNNCDGRDDNGSPVLGVNRRSQRIIQDEDENEEVSASGRSPRLILRISRETD